MRLRGAASRYSPFEANYKPISHGIINIISPLTPGSMLASNIHLDRATFLSAFSFIIEKNEKDKKTKRINRSRSSQWKANSLTIQPALQRQKILTVDFNRDEEADTVIRKIFYDVNV